MKKYLYFASAGIVAILTVYWLNGRNRFSGDGYAIHKPSAQPLQNLTEKTIIPSIPQVDAESTMLSDDRRAHEASIQAIQDEIWISDNASIELTTE